MINILISVNSKYVDKAKTMLFSLRCHTKEDVCVYLLNHSLKEQEIEKIRIYVQNKCKMSLKILEVSNATFDSLPLCDSQFSSEIYYRILAQFVLPEDIERILWLDADIVVLKDISEFYHQDFEDKYYIVCADSKNGKPWVEERKTELRLTSDYKYFNSGVMLMDLKELRDNTSADYIVTQSQQLKDKLVYPDQDILNYLYQNNVKYVDWKVYNYQLVCLDKIPKEDVKDIMILHYTGPNKPWDPYKITSHSKYYWRVRLKQGHIFATLKAYFIRIQDISHRYFKELKSIF